MTLRKTTPHQAVEKKVSLRANTVAKVELLLFDPVRNRVKYGGWSALINQLLEQWLDDQPGGEVNEQRESKKSS